ncbi:putative RING finger protein C2F3.16 [Colletotrichum tanaceti]|uniref:Putative RING finger protein C2F3.16 n=1 Tax=Colletotrichum tanaceti TaxID=1306861 RepID=A0A4U6XMF1_9PEZI|nr:putative RING finger protein C2F3.16 [Colletotrichum tanaceti]TKW56850.1 putative RING finger protein C2F3.16 [Colletotrichum tanaceti]
MSSLVSDFIINPVLRQARRFSEISRTTFVSDREPSSDLVTVATEPLLPAIRYAPDAPRPSAPTRPFSSSTLPTTVDDEPPQSPEAPAPISSSPIAVSMPPITQESLPADDGMGALRRRLISIQSQEIAAEDKARLMHEALMEGYRKSRDNARKDDGPASVISAGEAWEQPLPAPLETLKFWQQSPGEPSSPQKFILTADDVRPTFAPPKLLTREEPESALVLGCQHYRRNVKLQCSTCHKWYTCRFCHDAVEDHTLVRKETKNMLCMLCIHPQRASEACTKCGGASARYYCNVCKLWDDHPTNNIYHCNDCGICRRGRGIGKDFFHCKKCCACISVSIQQSHKCIERSTDCDCPICGEYMFTSPKPVVFMGCGHSIHQKCYDEHMLRSYKCPICNKSLLNMQSQFRQLELAILAQPMPPEFRDTRATVLCNDCSGKSSVPYHWLGLKCAICTSYNTVELQISSGRDGTPVTPTVVAPAQPGPAAVEAAAPARMEVPQVGRRRHSSHAGPEARHLMVDRLARSASPAPPVLPPNLASGVIEEEDEESENDIFNLWGRGRHDSDDSVSMSTDPDEEDSEGEDDDDDYENEIMLIGHR